MLKQKKKNISEEIVKDEKGVQNESTFDKIIKKANFLSKSNAIEKWTQF